MVCARLHEQEIRAAIGVPGTGERVIEGVVPLRAEEDHCLYWSGGALPEAQRAALARRRGCLLIARHGSGLGGTLGDCRVLEVDEPRAAIAAVLALVRELGRQPPWVATREIDPAADISPHAVIEGSVRIAENVRIGPFCSVGPDVSIGPGTVLEAGVHVHPRVAIGAGTHVGANTVLGHPGFGFVRDAAGEKTRIPQLGGIVIGSHVEIGALTAIECGAIAPTVIEDGAKLGLNTLVGHGSRVGRGASLVGGVILGGSSEVGAGAWLGINATVRDGRRVGRDAFVGMNASVQQDLGDGEVARAPRAVVTAEKPPTS